MKFRSELDELLKKDPEKLNHLKDKVSSCDAEICNSCAEVAIASGGGGNENYFSLLVADYGFGPEIQNNPGVVINE